MDEQMDERVNKGMNERTDAEQSIVRNNSNVQTNAGERIK
jgi:hypothetical protein